jgi:hypothetical protein
VLEKTLRRSLWSVAVLTVLCSAAWAQVPNAGESHVTISIHNDAGISLGILLQAESEASRIFRQSGIDLRWLNCSSPSPFTENPAACATAEFPSHLQLRIARRSLNLNEFSMGASYLSADGIGCYADVFFERATLIHETSRIGVATILGHGVAHEIGHLLLGANSHSPTGIMRAQWQSADLASASQGTLLFSPLESQEMHNKLASWRLHARAHSHIPSEPGD